MSISWLGDCLAGGLSTVTADDYARAERFLSWNKDRYVANADPQHHWIGREDRFWYLRTSVTGKKQVVVVDAASGKQTIESDWQRLAAPARAAAHEALSPDGKWAAFLQDRNVWIRPVSGGASYPLTSEGVEHYGYASSPGCSTHAVSDLRHPKPTSPLVLWSPDSRFLLTHRLDERQVRDLFLVQSVPDDGSVRPKLHTYRYAMPGDEHLPLLEHVVIDVTARRQVTLAAPPMICTVKTPIVQRNVWWAADSKTFYYLNSDRFSTSVSLHRADPRAGTVDQVLRETSDTFVQTNANNVFDFPLVRTLGNGDVIWYSQRDGWGHLYYYDSAGTSRNRITQGDWTVRDIVRIDERNKRIYFMASGREAGRDPYEQYLYSVRFDGSGLQLLTPEEGDHELPRPSSGSSSDTMPWAEAQMQMERFSPSGRYFVDSYSRPDKPPVLMLRAADGRLIKQLEQADVSQLRQGGYLPIEPFQVLAADKKTTVYGNLFRPSSFDPARKYPVIDSIYPGPQARRTRKRFAAATFDRFEAQSLAELGFIVITIDGRGTPHRSKAFLDYSHGRLDKASDLEDHIAGIRQLAQRYPYLDLQRVGIDGASGGGYAAAQALLAYPDFYKVAVSAEGNHDQRGYLAPWGETYIGAVERSDYSVAATAPLAANLEGKLLLMHGEMDDNVSAALTLKLVDALIKKNKDFDLLIVPNGNHDAFFTSPYFIRRKWDYFVRHLLDAEPPANYSIEQPQ